MNNKLTVTTTMTYEASPERGIMPKESNVTYKHEANDEHNQAMFSSPSGLPSKYGLAMVIYCLVQGLAGSISSMSQRFGVKEDHLIDQIMVSLLESMKARKHLDYSDELNNEN